MKQLLASALLVIASAHAMGQSLDEYEPILFPLAFRELPAAHGSHWEGRLIVLNAADRAVTMDDDLRIIPFCDFSAIPPCHPPPPTLLTGESLETRRLVPLNSRFRPSRVLYAAPDVAEFLALSFRIRDRSREVDAYGVEIPVIRERDLRTGDVYLLDLPNSSEFRTSLRVYSLPGDKAPGEPCDSVTVVLFELPSGAELHRFALPLSGPDGGECLRGPALHPNGAEIHLIERMIPEGSELTRFGIRLIGGAALRYWAMASVTNNATQHITLVTPQ